MSGASWIVARGGALLISLSLAACTASGGAGATRTSEVPTGGPGAGVLIECFDAEGTEIATFTRLEEAWASTNYTRIDHCEARVDPSGRFELTDEERAIAAIAKDDLPEDDATELFLRTLAACVRVPMGGDEGIATYPSSILEAVLRLCPEAPHAGLIESELATREG